MSSAAILPPDLVDRLPWPMAELWREVRSARAASDIARSLEHALPDVLALLLAGAARAEWPDYPDWMPGLFRRPGRPSIGRSLEALRLFAKAAQDTEPAIFVAASAWADFASEILQPIESYRLSNHQVSGRTERKETGHSAVDVSREAEHARNAVADAIRSATFIWYFQLLYVAPDTSERGAVLPSVLYRLVGGHAELLHSPVPANLRPGVIYLADLAGARMCELPHLRMSNQHPRLRFQEVDLNADGPYDRWQTFLDQRRALSAGWWLTLPKGTDPTPAPWGTPSTPRIAASSGSLSTTNTARLPYPIGNIASEVQRAENMADISRGGDNFVRVLFALLLADVLDLEWTKGERTILLGGESQQRWVTLGLGARVGMLETLVDIHMRAHEDETAVPRVLPPLGPWFEEVKSELDRLVDDRNKSSHATAPFPPKKAPDALASFNRVLRASRWLREVQLVTFGRPNNGVRGQRVTFQRHIGAEFANVAHRHTVTLETAFAQERVYMGRHDASAWTLVPFLWWELNSIRVLDTISNGELLFRDPAGVYDDVSPARGGIKVDGENLPWGRFVDTRMNGLAESFRTYLKRPPRELILTLPNPHELVPGAVVGHDYRLVRELGAGGMASVWEAEDIHTHATYALKIPLGERVDTEALARFTREIDLLKQLGGTPNVVGPVERVSVELDDDYLPMLRMPVYAGGTVASRLRSETQAGRSGLPHEEVQRIGADVLVALEAVHARGFVHRDVKPSNLLLDAAGSVVLADFGIARGRAASDLTQTRTAMGSELYQAPEQQINARRVGPKADLYSLAVTLHELITGEASRVPGKGITGAMGALITRMGAQDEDYRPTTAEALREWRALSAQSDPPDGGKPVLIISPTREDVGRWARVLLCAIREDAVGSEIAACWAMRENHSSPPLVVFRLVARAARMGLTPGEIKRWRAAARRSG